eukprot:333600_1
MNSIGLLGDGSLWRYKREFLNKHIKPIFLFIQYCGTYRALSIICGVKLRIKRRIVKYVFLLFFGCKNDNILLPILSARCANNAISGFGNIKISNGLIDKCPCMNVAMNLCYILWSLMQLICTPLNLEKKK